MSSDIVNGFICHNCTDIDYAKRNIDPAHPKDGPFGINADPASPDRGPAVKLDTRLKDLARKDVAGATTDAALPDARRGSGLTPGGRLDLSA